MSEPLYFHDNARLAAEHLLDSPFGQRLAQLGVVESCKAYLSVDTDAARGMVSSGERILLEVLESFADGDPYWRLDDAYWDRIIAALFMARGRVGVPS